MKGDTKLKYCIFLLSFFAFQFMLAWGASADEGFDPIPEVSEGDIQFYVDYTSFKNLEDEKKIYLEMYLSLLGDQLTYIQEESKYCAVVEVSVVLRDVRGSRVKTEHWKLGCEVATFEDTRSRRFLFDVIGFIIKPGEYSLEVKIKDSNSSKEGSKKLTVRTPSFKKSALLISQIELAAKIEPDTSKHKLVKNSRKITPNPMRVYGINWPMLYFYAEVYNLSEGGTYTTQYSIIDEQGNVIKEYPSKELQKPGTTSIIMSGLNVVALSRGYYVFQIKVIDNASLQEAVAQRSFLVLKPQIPTAEAAGEIPAELTKVEVERQSNLIQYIASKEELEVYKGLKIEGKKQFLEEFWKRRDPKPETPTNEFKMEHLLRFDEANRLFSSANKEGWKSDFGRVFILYGKPDETERHDNEIDLKPYEIWYYFNIEGGVQFVFGDLDGFGTYRLIHSTVRNEVYDPDFHRWLQQGPR